MVVNLPFLCSTYIIIMSSMKLHAKQQETTPYKQTYTQKPFYALTGETFKLCSNTHLLRRLHETFSDFKSTK